MNYNLLIVGSAVLLSIASAGILHGSPNLVSNLVPYKESLCSPQAFTTNHQEYIPGGQKTAVVDLSLGSRDGPTCAKPCEVTVSVMDQKTSNVQILGTYPHQYANIYRQCPLTTDCQQQSSVMIVWYCEP